MFNGTVSYKAPAIDVEFDPIKATYDGVPITLQSSRGDNGITLEVSITNAASREAALNKASQVARTVPKLLTYKLGKHCGGFGHITEALSRVDDVTGKIVHSIGTTLNLVHRFDSTVKLDQQNQEELKKLLEQPNRPGYIYYEVFRSALSLDDVVSKFMVLYGAILLSVFNDRQEVVDAYVLSKQPAVPTSPPFNPRKSGVPETVYTRLRNQIGHVRAGTTIDGTRTEMETHLSGLIEITKALIDTQP